MCGKIILEQTLRKAKKNCSDAKGFLRVKDSLTKILPIGDSLDYQNYSMSFPMDCGAIDGKSDITEVLTEFNSLCDDPMSAAIAADNPKSIPRTTTLLNCALVIARKFPHGLVLTYAAQQATPVSFRLCPTVHHVKDALKRVRPKNKSMIQKISSKGIQWVSAEGVAVGKNTLLGVMAPEVLRDLENRRNTPMDMDVDMVTRAFRVMLPVITRLY